jgi:glyoxylase-like metal-dependent hydrolase (beta-lactamase superfamily II)
MYLLLGEQRALLIDTGTSARAAVVPISTVVGRILRDRASMSGGPLLPLVVCHTHGHEDHVAGDAQFPGASVVGHRPADVRAFFSMSETQGLGRLDLGGRRLDVLRTPGHEPSHITLYDSASGVLFTGDLLYPGLLTVNDWPAYRSSVRRLATFASAPGRRINHILGAHIEMKRTGGRFFGYPRPFFQPDEHVLQLDLRHLDELRAAVERIGTTLSRDDRHEDFIIHPGSKPPPPEDP